MNPYVAEPNLAFLGGLGVPELIIIFLIILVLFGAGKIPNIAKDIGNGIKEFKRAMNEEPKPRDDDKKNPHA